MAGYSLRLFMRFEQQVHSQMTTLHTYIFGATPVYRLLFWLLFFLSCGACKPEQTKKDLLIKIGFQTTVFFMTYKYFIICCQHIEEVSATGIEPTDTGVWGQRSTSYTTADCKWWRHYRTIFLSNSDFDFNPLGKWCCNVCRGIFTELYRSSLAILILL